MEKAAALAGYAQCLASWLSKEQPFVLGEDDYLVYTFNRFQACRFGLDGTYVDPASGEHHLLRDEILRSFERIGAHAADLRAEQALSLLRHELGGTGNDAGWIRALQARERLLPEVVRQQTLRWSGEVA